MSHYFTVVRGPRVGVRKDTEHPVLRNIIDVGDQGVSVSGPDLDTFGIFGGFTSTYIASSYLFDTKACYEYIGAYKHYTKFWMYAPGPSPPQQRNYLGPAVGYGSPTWTGDTPVGRVVCNSTYFASSRVSSPNPVIKSLEGFENFRVVQSVEDPIRIVHTESSYYDLGD